MVASYAWVSSNAICCRARNTVIGSSPASITETSAAPRTRRAAVLPASLGLIGGGNRSAGGRAPSGGLLRRGGAAGLR